jgi:DNA-binding MarR family transcriptional regulator
MSRTLSEVSREETKRDLLHSLFRIKKVTNSIFRYVLNVEEDGLSIAELSALGCIGSRCENGCDAADQTTHNAMHETLAVSKAAVSQMLGSLEKRDYIRRETDRDNRRKIIITLTKKGKSAVDAAKKNMDALLLCIVERFGVENSRNLVRLLDRFAETADGAIGGNG